MIDTRFVPAVCLVIALALLPTLIHSYGSDGVSDGLSTASIPTSLFGYTSTPSARGRNWGANQFGSTDWVEREYTKGDDEIRLTVIRSFDLKSLYHHPELAVAYGSRFGASFNGQRVIRLPDVPQMPIHVLIPSPGTTARAMYVLHYDDRFVEDPMWFHLRTAATLLVSGRKAMTLFFVHDLAAPNDADVETLPAASLLREAIARFTAASVAAP